MPNKIKRERQTMSDKKLGCHARVDYMRRAFDKIVTKFKKYTISNNYKDIVLTKPDVIIDSHKTVKRFRLYCDKHNAYLIASRHGVANKYIGPDEEFKYADYFCGSDWDKQDLISHDVIPYHGFLLTGNPWTDDVFKIKSKKINTKCPTFLFAPTWNEETSAAFFFNSDLIKLISKKFQNFKIIVKLHPAILHAGNYDFNAPPKNLIFNVSHPYIHKCKKIVSYWRKQARTHENIEFIDDTTSSIDLYYKDSDILISDGSSLVWEFMTLKRPILLYDSKSIPQIWSVRKSQTALANSQRNIGYNFSNYSEFTNGLDNIFLEHKNKYAKLQSELTDKMFGIYQDGNNIKRLIKEIKKLPPITFIYLRSESDPSVRQIKSDFLNHYSNIKLEIYPIEKFFDNGEIKESILDNKFKSKFVIITNINTKSELFSLTYAGKLRRETENYAITGFFAHQFTANTSCLINTINHRALKGKLKNESISSVMQNFGTDVFIENNSKFCYCINMSKCEISLDNTILNFNTLRDSIINKTYVKNNNYSNSYVVCESKYSISSNIYKKYTLSEILEYSKTSCKQHFSDYHTNLIKLSTIFHKFDFNNIEALLLSVKILTEKSKYFYPGILFFSKLLTLASRPDLAIKQLCKSLKVNPHCNELLRDFIATLYNSAIYSTSVPDQSGFTNIPFGYIDFPENGRSSFEIFPIRGWCALYNDFESDVILTVNGSPLHDLLPIKRDTVSNAYSNSSDKVNVSGFYVLYDSQNIDRKQPLTIELFVINSNKVYCISKRTILISENQIQLYNNEDTADLI